MKIENVLIEHFPRLKCANFFILFNKSLDDVSSVRVNLRPTEILVNFENDRCTTIELTSLSVQIQINSLSLLIAKDNLISFRINIASSFREEILPTSLNHLHSFKQLNLNVEPNDEFYVICDNCGGPLSDLLHFRRILELPSENMDSNEWFCHKPHVNHQHNDDKCNGKSHSSINEFKISDVTPNDDDLLFGNFFIMFNRKPFKNIQVNSSHKQTHCRRCLNHIGSCLSNNTLKLWNGNIKMEKLNERCPLQRIFTDSDSLIENFLAIVNRISYDFHMLGRQTIKLLFEAQNLKGTITFLFIQTMARNLELYQMVENSEKQSIISMIQVDGIKCLFLCEENSDQALVDFWQKDVNVVSAEISIEMLDFVVEYLQRLSNYVPEQFRMNNGFCLSYLSHGIR